jgi:hypothetical protein
MAAGAQPVLLSGAEVFAILRLRGIISSEGNTGEHLLPPVRCHRMVLTPGENGQLLQLREALKANLRSLPRNASERREAPGGRARSPLDRRIPSLRTTESAMKVKETYARHAQETPRWKA